MKNAKTYSSADLISWNERVETFRALRILAGAQDLMVLDVKVSDKADSTHRAQVLMQQQVPPYSYVVADFNNRTREFYCTLQFDELLSAKDDLKYR